MALPPSSTKFKLSLFCETQFENYSFTLRYFEADVTLVSIAPFVNIHPVHLFSLHKFSTITYSTRGAQIPKIVDMIVLGTPEHLESFSSKLTFYIAFQFLGPCSKKNGSKRSKKWTFSNLKARRCDSYLQSETINH